MTIERILTQIQDDGIEFVDLRFTDTKGKEQHVSLPAHQVNTTFFEEGKAFDGSSIHGWKGIEQSDMIMLPDPSSAVIDPFCSRKTMILRCDIVDPQTSQGYTRDPRSIAKRAEQYLKNSGLADTALFGPEPEFFIFDDVKFKTNISGSMYQVDSHEACWNSNTNYAQGNMGHRPLVKGGYFPVAPVDSHQELRSNISATLEKVGLVVEAHHHEVATAGQNEIATQCRSLLQKADEIQMLKYVVHNEAHLAGKTATFMPKPLIGDNGSGMHCHQSLIKGEVNLFAGEEYAGLSETALYYMGGIIKHARALNAFTNPTTNSYKRLVPGFEAPVLLAYSARNRSASIRIPQVESSKQRRIEVRFPDATANPYLALSAMLMAGLDGIQNKIHPSNAMDKNLYDLPPEEMNDIPTVAGDLNEALQALHQDREFLLKNQVFTHDFIDSYIALKQEEVSKLQQTTHPVEFEMYYSL